MCWNCVRAGDSISTAVAQANQLASDDASEPQSCTSKIHTLEKKHVFNEVASVWKHATQSSVCSHVPKLVCGVLQSRA